jgi:hypothetical protein
VVVAVVVVGGGGGGGGGGDSSAVSRPESGGLTWYGEVATFAVRW